MRYIEVIFKTEPNTQNIRDIITALAAEDGFESFIDGDEGVKGYCKEELFDFESLKYTFSSFPIEGVKIEFEVNKMEDKNWNEEWEKNGFEPIIIENTCAIICKSMADKEDCSFLDNIPTKIVIDAQQAFGTGTHETTQMIVSLLVNEKLNEKRVLDCGCGTGILGIVASKYGAKEAVCYDIDEWSVRNTIHNAELNGVTLEVLEGDKGVLSHINGVFDYVIANINRNIILDDIEAFASVMTTNSKMILSGFYEEDADIILKSAQALGLTEKSRLVNHDWCCLLLEKE